MENHSTGYEPASGHSVQQFVDELVMGPRSAFPTGALQVEAKKHSNEISSLNEELDGLPSGERLEEIKESLLGQRLRHFACKQEIRRANQRPDIAEHDVSSGVRKDIKELERDIKKDGLVSKKLLWNSLEKLYDIQERRSLADGRDYEAAEWNSAMMRARCWRSKAQGKHGRFVWLAFLGVTSGFGNRLLRVLLWCTVMVAAFAVAYFIGYDTLFPDHVPPSDQAWETPYRILHSIHVSLFLLIAPDRLDLKPENVWLTSVLSIQAAIRFVVAAGLVAVTVNRITSRRKW